VRLRGRVHDLASPLTRNGIPGLAALVALAFVVAVWHVYGRSLRAGLLALVGVSSWMSLTGGLAASGVLARFDAWPPPFAALLVSLWAVALGVGLSPVGRRLAGQLPLGALVLAQGFRLPLELVMHGAAAEGVMPEEMSYSGYNFDIVTGAAAFVVGGLALAGKAPRALVWGWNVAGWFTLLTVVTLAVAASPLFRAFGDDPRHVNTWVAHFPFVWLPAVLVVFAAIGHLAVTRRLLSREG